MFGKNKLIRQKYIGYILTVAGLSIITFGFLLSSSSQSNGINDKLTGFPLNYPESISQNPELSEIDLNEIFRYMDPQIHIEKGRMDESREIRLIATGDVIPGRSVNAQTVRRNDFRYPFLKTAGLLNTADIVFINLESPLIKNCPVTVEGMVFCGDERNIEGLKYANVRVANLANNHLSNYGKDGTDNTVRLLNENGIQVTGLGEPAIITVKGKRFGFLGYNDVGKYSGIENADETKIISAVKLLKSNVDYIIVAFHWGVEYVSYPTVRQEKLAHLSIDNGADLIIGNHPHWVQGVEIYKNKFITYAHGNFVFDQMWSQETKEGVVGEYVFGVNGLEDIRYYPVIIENYAQPRYADPQEAGKILKRMEDSTRRILLENKS